MEFLSRVAGGFRTQWQDEQSHGKTLDPPAITSKSNVYTLTVHSRVTQSEQPRGGVSEVSWVFLKLGCTAFGGPIAHIAYFRHEFVRRREWLSEENFAQFLTICQFLPGPSSSQLGFLIGLSRAGWFGAIAAFVSFTLPSALLLFLFGTLSARLRGQPWESAIHGLKLVAVVVVAQNIFGMIKTLTPDLYRKLIAAGAAALILVTPTPGIQLAVVAGGALLGLLCINVSVTSRPTFTLNLDRRLCVALLVAFVTLLALALTAEPASSAFIQMASAFYRAGALVFGGGHVVLPLLKQVVVEPGFVSEDNFLVGYGLAQAMPGPMFTLAAYLGTQWKDGSGGATGAIVSLAAIFLPGFLLLSGVLPFWQKLAALKGAVRCAAGANAAVVGVLVAAFLSPVLISAVRSQSDVAIALAALTLMVVIRCPILVVIAFCVGASFLA